MVALKPTRFSTSASVLALAAFLPAAAAAQESTSSISDETIVVTGSRIASSPLDNPFPVVTLSEEQIERSGHVNFADLLAEAPALVSSTVTSRTAGTNARPGQVGINLLNLRKLGEQRTLVLVNGRRHVSSLPGVSAVDINTIPTALVERVDVLTGGVSAIYGADGVSGVVNFVLKRDFEGIELHGQNGVSSRGDSPETFASVTAGHNFNNGAGNIAVAYEFRRLGRVQSDSRRSGRAGDFYTFHQNLADLPDNPGVPDRILYNDIRYMDQSPLGAVDVNGDFIPDFTGTGAPYDRGLILPVPGGFVQGGDSISAAGYGGDLQPSVETHNVNLLASYEYSPAFRVFAEGKYVSSKSQTQSQPFYDPTTILVADNAFIPASIAAAIVPGALRRYGLPIEGILVNRNHLDFGIRGSRSNRETWRAVAGADGEVAENLRYELAYTYGETTNRFTNLNERIADRYAAALDAVNVGGEVRCRADVMPQFPNFNLRGPYLTFTPGPDSGCVPINILGSGVATPEALAFFITDVHSVAKVSQHVVSGTITGDTGAAFALPGGPVRFAAGAEYRVEKSRFTPDPLLVQGVIIDLAKVDSERGSYNVKELFAEVRLPVLAGAPAAELLEFGGAVRFSDYSTIGSTTTWKVDGIYAPIRDIRIRGTYSQSVRAPNITELYSPQIGTFTFLRDPCDITRQTSGSVSRAANCATLLTALGVDPTTFRSTTSPAGNALVSGFGRGNPDLKEETAKTWTAGTVITPRFLPGLVASFDWYDIRLRNAINTPQAQQLLDLCVDQPSLDNVFCPNIARNPATGIINGFTIAPANVSRFRSSGADLTIDYAFAPDPQWGAFNLRLAAGYLDTLSLVATPGAAASDDTRKPYAPRWSGSMDLFWKTGPFGVNYGVTYFSKTRRFTAEEVAANPDIVAPEYVFFRERWQHDVQLSADVHDEATFYAGIQNLFDRAPDVGEYNYPISFRGRYFYFGIKANFGRP